MIGRFCTSLGRGDGACRDQGLMASYAIMKATLLIRERVVYPDGGLVEMVVWQVPAPVPPSNHLYKYSLVYVVDGIRLLGYDNERGKGDHRHFGATEEPVNFTTLAAHLDRFVEEVETIRRQG